MNPTYRGPLKAAILDWAGTTVDFGCQAPVVVLQELFLQHGVEVSLEEVRRHMGVLKKDHIRAILDEPRVADVWAVQHGKQPVEQDVEMLFEKFAPRQIKCIGEFSDVIPGVPEAVAQMCERGMRIGSTTGYTRPMLNAVLSQAAEQGYRPDATVTPDEAGGGRPAPWMCFLNLIRLQTFPPEACVKIGDTPVDIQEGLNAGMWTVGVIDSGNEIGLTVRAWNQLDCPSRERLRASARERLIGAGADFAVNSLSEIGGVLDEIERRLQGGEK